MKLETNFKNYLDNTDLVPTSFDDSHPGLFIIRFSNVVSPEQFSRIKEFLHIKPEIRCVVYDAEDGKKHEFCSSEECAFCSNDTITIHIPHFRIFYNVYELIKSFGVKIEGAKISEGEIEYEYKLKGRSVLNYDELSMLHAEAHPNTERRHSFYPMGCNGEYTLTFRFDMK